MRYVTRALCGFPLLLLGSFYATWAVGRLEFGYWPGPGRADPGEIKVMHDVTHLLIEHGIPLFGIALIVLTLICVFRRPEGWKFRLLELFAAGMLFVGVFLFCNWDPQSVITWYFD